VLTLLAAAAGAGATHGSEDAVAREHGLVYTDLVRATSGPCRGFYAVGGACTHGPDPAPPGIDVRRRATLTELRARARDARTKAGAGAALPCSGDAPYSVQAVYARPEGTPDRLSSYRPLFEQWAQDVEWVFDQSATETGGQRAVRFVTDADCKLSILSVTLSPKAVTSFPETVVQLASQGFTDKKRKYLVWADVAVGICGLGQYVPDTRASQNNQNNGNWSGPQFARVDEPCWGQLGKEHSVEAHELVHTLGAVAFGAPHATPYGHCKDESDTMCYVDGRGVSMQQVCPPSHEVLLDCNHDDYFSTDPPTGTWLAKHWNTANSRFLIGSAVPPPPPPPPGPPGPPPPPPPPPAGASGTTTTITAAATTLPADGKSRTQITVQAKDAKGNNLSGSGGFVELSTNAGTLAAVSDNHDGTYTTTLTAPAHVGFAIVRGRIAGSEILRPAFVGFSPAKHDTHSTQAAAKCTVPKLAGKKVFDAVILVVRARCTPKLVYAYSTRVRTGVVIAQKPKPGTTLPSGGRTDVVLSKGPKPKRR
jgi:Invasin, domain 3/PASTA domain